MKIAMIQNKITDDIQSNIDEMETWLKQCEGADLVVMSELWNCKFDNSIIPDSTKYFSRCIQLFEMYSEKNHQTIVGGTIAEPENGEIYNTCFVYSNGQFVTKYRKTHLMEFHAHKNYAEKDVFTPGNSFSTFKINNLTVGLFVCYDIRFPELARCLCQDGATLLLAPACFNHSVGPIHWRPTLQTRAMENQVFVCGVNVTGYGHSLVADPFGKVICEMDDQIGIQLVDIDVSEIEKYRKRMPFWQVRRTDLYELKETQNETNKNQ